MNKIAIAAGFVLAFLLLASGSSAASETRFEILRSYESPSKKPWSYDYTDKERKIDLMRELMETIDPNEEEAPIWIGHALRQIHMLETNQIGSDYAGPLPAEKRFAALVQRYPDSLPARSVQYEAAHELLATGRTREAQAMFEVAAKELIPILERAEEFNVLKTLAVASPKPEHYYEQKGQAHDFIANIIFYAAYASYKNGDIGTAKKYMERLEAFRKGKRNFAASRSFGVEIHERWSADGKSTEIGWLVYGALHASYRGQECSLLNEPLWDLARMLKKPGVEAPTLAELYGEAQKAQKQGQGKKLLRLGMDYLNLLLEYVRDGGAGEYGDYNPTTLLGELFKSAGTKEERLKIERIGLKLAELSPRNYTKAYLLLAIRRYAELDKLIQEMKASANFHTYQFAVDLEARRIEEAHGLEEAAEYNLQILPELRRRVLMEPSTSQVRLNPGFSLGIPYLRAASAFEKAGKLDRAISVYEEGIREGALAQSTLSVSTQSSQVFLSMRVHLADIEQARGNTAKARRLLQEVIRHPGAQADHARLWGGHDPGPQGQFVYSLLREAEKRLKKLEFKSSGYKPSEKRRLLEAYWARPKEDPGGRIKLMRSFIDSIDSDEENASAWLSYALWQFHELEIPCPSHVGCDRMPIMRRFGAFVERYPATIPAMIAKYGIAHELMANGRIREAQRLFAGAAGALEGMPSSRWDFHTLEEFYDGPKSVSAEGSMGNNAWELAANTLFSAAYSSYKLGDSPSARAFIRRLKALPRTSWNIPAASAFHLVLNKRWSRDYESNQIGWTIGMLGRGIRFENREYSDLDEPIWELERLFEQQGGRKLMLSDLEARAQDLPGEYLRRYLDALYEYVRGDAGCTGKRHRVVESLRTLGMGARTARKEAELKEWGRRFENLCGPAREEILLASRDYEGALRLAERQKRSRTSSGVARSFLYKGIILLDAKGVKAQADFMYGALPEYEELILRQPTMYGPGLSDDDWARLYMTAAKAMESVQEPEKAIEIYRKGIKRIPTSQYAQSMNIRLADLYCQQGRQSDAERILRGVLEHPKSKVWELYSTHQGLDTSWSIDDGLHDAAKDRLKAMGKDVLGSKAERDLARRMKLVEQYQVYRHDWPKAIKFLTDLGQDVAPDERDTPLWNAFVLWHTHWLEKWRGSWEEDAREYPVMPLAERFKHFIAQYPDSLPTSIVRYELAHELLRARRYHEAQQAFLIAAEKLLPQRQELSRFHDVLGSPGGGGDVWGSNEPKAAANSLLANVLFFGAYASFLVKDPDNANRLLAALDELGLGEREIEAAETFGIDIKQEHSLSGNGLRLGWELVRRGRGAVYRKVRFDSLNEPIWDLKSRLASPTARGPSLKELGTTAIHASGDDFKPSALRYLESLSRHLQSHSVDKTHFTSPAPQLLARLYGAAVTSHEKRTLQDWGVLFHRCCNSDKCKARMLFSSGNRGRAEKLMEEMMWKGADSAVQSFLLRGELALQTRGQKAQAELYSRILPHYEAILSGQWHSNQLIEELRKAAALAREKAKASRQ